MTSERNTNGEHTEAPSFAMMSNLNRCQGAIEQSVGRVTRVSIRARGGRDGSIASGGQALGMIQPTLTTRHFI